MLKLTQIQSLAERNLVRAGWAEFAVEAFAEATRMTAEDLPTKIHDLLTDLRHLADREHLDFDTLINNSAETHKEERHDDGY